MTRPPPKSPLFPYTTLFRSHRLALQVDLPVLRQLPVEALAQAFEHRWSRSVPTGRCDQCLRHREAGRLHHLGSLAIADIDDYGLEVERLVVDVAHQANGDVSPHLVAILA